jgi:hypothetical protein
MNLLDASIRAIEQRQVIAATGDGQTRPPAVTS